jgi:hypothetical protein
MKSTPHFGIDYPEGSDPAKNLSSYFASLATQVDNVMYALDPENPDNRPLEAQVTSLAARVTSLAARVTSLEQIVTDDSGWIALSARPNVTVVDYAAYRRLRGVVYFRGRIRPTVETSWAIPAGFRPAMSGANRSWLIDNVGAGLRCWVDADGSVFRVASTTTAFVDLSAVTWVAEA